MSNSRLSPVLKWAGGKTQLLDALRERMPASFRRYYEPFVGGGALFLALEPRAARLNDINGQLINLYQQIRDNSEEIIATVSTMDDEVVDKERYYAIRARYNEKIAASALDAECAALMLWLNKHCFNGLYRVNNKGLFNVPFNNRCSGASLVPENIRGIAAYLRASAVELTCGDFAAAVADASAGDFVYFDSPYVPVSETASFTDYTKTGFSYEEHVRLAELFQELDARGVQIMLSNNDVPLVHELYAGFKIEAFDVKRMINSKASRRTGREVIVTNY